MCARFPRAVPFHARSFMAYLPPMLTLPSFCVEAFAVVSIAPGVALKSASICVSRSDHDGESISNAPPDSFPDIDRSSGTPPAEEKVPVTFSSATLPFASFTTSRGMTMPRRSRVSLTVPCRLTAAAPSPIFGLTVPVIERSSAFNDTIVTASFAKASSPVNPAMARCPLGNVKSTPEKVPEPSARRSFLSAVKPISRSVAVTCAFCAATTR